MMLSNAIEVHLTDLISHIVFDENFGREFLPLELRLTFCRIFRQTASVEAEIDDKLNCGKKWRNL
jgi:hypothetical protein